MTTPILNNSPPGTGIAAYIAASTSKSTTSQERINIFGEDGFTFGNLLDIVNPLHHIPIVGMIYRKLTGDTIAPVMQIVGDGLFGGPLGAAISVVTTAFQSQFKTNSTDPASPHMDQDSTTTDPELIANNTSQQSPKIISSSDYSQTPENPALAQYELSIKAAKSSMNETTTNTNKEITIDNQNALSTNINRLQSNNFYQPRVEIVNLAYKGTETYTNVVTSSNTPTEQG